MSGWPHSLSENKTTFLNTFLQDFLEILKLSAFLEIIEDMSSLERNRNR